MIRRAGIAMVLLVSAGLALASALVSVPAGPWLAGGIALFTLGLWALAALPEVVTAIAFFLAAMLLHAAPANVIFAGFTSTAWWLIFGGLIVGLAIERTGLARRIAAWLFARVGGTFARAVLAVAVMSVVLAFLMPSTMGRIVLLVPIVLALADRLGFPDGTRGRAGLVMTAALATYVPSVGILPSNVPNTVLLGAAETLYGIKLTYAPYLVLHFPVFGLLYLPILILVMLRLFGDTPHPRAAAVPVPPALSDDERRLSWILALALVAYATDFVHGVSPAWVSLAAGLVCLLPWIGMVPPTVFSERMNLSALVYIAAIIGVGTLVSQSGLGALFAEWLIGVLRPHPGADAWNFFSIVALSALVSVASSVVAQPAVLTPLAQRLADAAGLPLETVLMMNVVGFAVVLFPYQSPPMVVAMQLGGVRVRQGLRIALVMGLVVAFVLVPAAYLWWRVLGRIG